MKRFLGSFVLVGLLSSVASAGCVETVTITPDNLLLPGAPKNIALKRYDCSSVYFKANDILSLEEEYNTTLSRRNDGIVYKVVLRDGGREYTIFDGRIFGVIKNAF